MRKPDLIIGPPDNPYIYRWHLLRFCGWQLALHKMMRDDDDRALHDHRAWNISFVLRGGYLEWFSHRGAPTNCVWRPPGSVIFRRAATPHRLTVGHETGPSWSIWLRGKPSREWGFWCPKGWRHWREFCGEDYTAPGAKASTVGKGCD